MAERHRDRAQQDGPALAEHTIGDEPAQDRRQIDRRRVGPEDGGGERLAVEPAIEAPKLLEEGDILDMAGEQQLLDHVENEQGLHAVEGETLPSLGEGEVAQTLGMAEKGAVVAVERDLRRRFGQGHRASPLEAPTYRLRAATPETFSGCGTANARNRVASAARAWLDRRPRRTRP